MSSPGSRAYGVEWRHGCAGLGFPATAVARGRGAANRDDDAMRLDDNLRFGELGG
jgi:hypothetical protein